MEEAADVIVHRPTKLWVMRESDVPEGVTTVLPTKLPGIVIVFAPLKKRGMVRNGIKQVD